MAYKPSVYNPPVHLPRLVLGEWQTVGFSFHTLIGDAIY